MYVHRANSAGRQGSVIRDCAGMTRPSIRQHRYAQRRLGGGWGTGIYDQQRCVWTVRGNEDSQWRGASPKRPSRLRISIAWCLTSPPLIETPSLLLLLSTVYSLTQIPVLLNIALKECEFAQVEQFAWNCEWIWWAPKVDLQTQAQCKKLGHACT